jgi:hypothetical protein
MVAGRYVDLDLVAIIICGGRGLALVFSAKAIPSHDRRIAAPWVEIAALLGHTNEKTRFMCGL